MRPTRPSLLAAAALTLSWGSAAHATTITVGALTDGIANNGVCTLREAIRAANLNAASGAMPGECPAGENNATDVIVLGAGTHTLTLAGVNEDAALTGDLDIADNAASPDVILQGAAIVSQNASPDDRVMHVLAGASLEVSGVSIRNGGNVTAGGGVLVESGASLFLTGVTVTANRATNQGGGISNEGGNVTIVGGSQVNSNTVTGASIPRGGGIFNSGALVVASSTINGNSAAERGGALFNMGNAQLIQGTTLSSNTAHYGGGFYSDGGPTTVIDSLIASNAADGGGGGFMAFSLVDVQGSRLLANTAGPSGNTGGAVFNAAFATNNVVVNGSCISGNTDVAVQNAFGLPQNAANNWWGADDGSASAGGNGDTSQGFSLFPMLQDPPVDGCGQLLTVAGAGPATGSVAAATGGVAIACGIDAGTASGDCTSTIRTGRTVQLVATPGPGSAFAGWTGCNSVSGNTCTATMIAPRTVTASFDVACYTLIAPSSPTVGGTVSADPPANCPGGYTPNTQVTVTATAQAPYSFVGWAGALAGGPNPGTLVMDADKTATARFTENFELSHGTRQIHDLRTSVNVADMDWYRITQAPYSSYEVVVDEASGDIGPVSLDRFDASLTLVQGSAPASALDFARTLRWANLTADPVTADRIRVRSENCVLTPCGIDDTYRIRAYDTTYAIPRFNNSASQVTVVFLQNPTNGPVSGELHFWNAAGSHVGMLPFSLGAKETLVQSTTTAAPSTSGSITIAHDGGYGTLTGKAVTIEVSSGFTFDTPMSPRAR